MVNEDRVATLSPEFLAKLAERLGLWKPGQICSENGMVRFPENDGKGITEMAWKCLNCGHVVSATNVSDHAIHCGHVVSATNVSDHAIPPPDLLTDAGFSVMVEAALRRRLDIHLEMNPYGDFIAGITRANDPYCADGIDPDKTVALAKALIEYFERSE